MEEIKTKKFIQKTDSHLKTSRNLFEGEVKCFKCGTIHTYESLLDGGRCTECKVELIGELF